MFLKDGAPVFVLGVAVMGPVSAQVCVSTGPGKSARSAAARRHHAWGKLGIARLRLDLVRLATRLVGRERAQELVQRAFRAAVRLGPSMPRDRSNIPSATHMVALVRRIAKNMSTPEGGTTTSPAARRKRSVAKPTSEGKTPRVTRTKKPAKPGNRRREKSTLTT